MEELKKRLEKIAAKEWPDTRPYGWECACGGKVSGGLSAAIELLRLGHECSYTERRRMASALLAVLEIHSMVKTWPGNPHSKVDYCSCGDDWPCPTVEAIQKAMGAK